MIIEILEFNASVWIKPALDPHFREDDEIE